MVVASHERVGPLGVLLDALSAQTLAQEAWEVVIVHTYLPGVAARLLEGHELGRRGSLRHLRVAPPDASPAAQRNRGWRLARAPRIAFTDDDCRPEPDWLENLVRQARAHPGAVVQGTTLPDMLSGGWGAPHIRTLEIYPPAQRMQTCNILYERALLDRLRGFDERAITGEDIELGFRARKAGAPLVAAEEAVVHHAVEVLSWREKIRSNRKWAHLAYVVKRHPELRRQCCMGIWWKREHFRAAVALAGLIGARRRPWLAVAVVPYYRLERYRLGPGRRARLRALRWMPEFWLIEIAEIGTLMRGSLRYRTLLL